jgi:hypothetical protein
MYYNTTNETGKELKVSRQSANTQETIILDFFKNNSNLHLSPFDIHDILELNAPITSIRRAMTNLTINGKLKKTSTMKLGPYGKKVHTWRLNNE